MKGKYIYVWVIILGFVTIAIMDKIIIHFEYLLYIAFPIAIVLFVLNYKFRSEEPDYISSRESEKR